MKIWVFAALLLVGCGKKGGDSAKPSNAGKAPREAVLGVWTVDVARLAEQPHLLAMPPEQRTLSVEMARGMLRSMTVEFTSERYAIRVGGAANEGSYTVRTESGARLVLAAKGDNGEATEMTVTVEGEGLLLEPAPDEHPIPLARK